MATIISNSLIPASFGRDIPGGSVRKYILKSSVLDAEKSFTVYLPRGYEDNPAKRYPVVYLFHPAGSTDETWVTTGQLREILNDGIRSQMITDMIVVMPDARGTNEHNLGPRLGFFSVDGWDYERYFFEELVPLVDSTFRTIANREHRAVAGASMAGEAAVAYAQKHPDMFIAAASLSGILGKPEQSKMAKTDKAYGDSLIANNPTLRVTEADDAGVEALKTVRWYADCGDNDYFYEGNIDFFLAMKSRGIPVNFRMRSGVHGFYYWITGMMPLLQFVSAAFAG